MKNRVEAAQTPIYNANPRQNFSESLPVPTHQHITCLLQHCIPETPNTVCQESSLETMTFPSLLDDISLTNHVSSFFSFYACLHQKFPEGVYR